MSTDPQKPATTIYEKRAVAFLDILGFTDLIQEGREQEISEIFDHLKFRAEQVGRPLSSTGRMQFTAFSDCIVVSEEHLNGFGALRIAGYAGYLALDLLARGFLVRGGLAVGDLHHRDGTVFGPAMIEAYRLESKIAVHPRIAVSQPFIAAACDGAIAEAGGQASDPRVLSVVSQYRPDFDGVLHLDIFNPLVPSPSNFTKVTNGVITSDDRGRAAIEAVRKVRALRFKAAAAQKYDWMDNYLRDCVKRYGWNHLYA